MDYIDEDYDFNLIDPIDAFFLNELIEYNNNNNITNTNNNITPNHLSSYISFQNRLNNSNNNNKNNHNNKRNNNNNYKIYKEGKLVIKIDEIIGIIRSRYDISLKYECEILFDNISYKFNIPIELIQQQQQPQQQSQGNNSNNNNQQQQQQQQQQSQSTNRQQEFIFDIFEYYGGMKLKIIIKKKTLFTSSIIGEIELLLHNILLEQEQAENSQYYIPLSTIREQNSSNSLALNTFWGYDKILKFPHLFNNNNNNNNNNNSNNNINNKKRNNNNTESNVQTLSIHLKARYIPIYKCVNCDINKRYYNLYKTELHHVAMTGSSAIMISLIELLARKNLLKTALNLRESPDGTHGYNTLELALISRNISVAKVLLQRAGNLCFHGIYSNSSLLPPQLLKSPYDHLGNLNKIIDIKSLQRPIHSNSNSSPSSSSSSTTSTISSTSPKVNKSFPSNKINPTLSISIDNHSIPNNNNNSYNNHNYNSASSPLLLQPHASTVDKSFNKQLDLINTSTTSIPPTILSQLPNIFQIKYHLSPNELLLYSGGSPIHISILGGSECLQLILTFLTKYSQVVTGWEGVSTLSDMIEYTSNRYDDITPFMLACQLGDYNSVKLLYDLKKNPNILQSGSSNNINNNSDNNNNNSNTISSNNMIISLKYVSKQTGYTPLMLACYSGNYEILNLILNTVESVDSQLPIAADGLNLARVANSSSRKTLEKYFYNESYVSLLSCIPLAKDYQGRQAITIASMYGYNHIVQLLINKGISYLTRDINGMTPLHYSAFYGHKSVCDVIIRTEYLTTSKFDLVHYVTINKKKKYLLKGNRTEDYQLNNNNLSETNLQLISSNDNSNNNNNNNSNNNIENLETDYNQDNVSDDLLKNSSFDSMEYYSYQIPTNKSVFNSTSNSAQQIKSVNYMTRRPNALLEMDFYGHRPADIALKRGFPEITIRLHIAVLEIYGISHPPSYSNKQNLEPLRLCLIDENNIKILNPTNNSSNNNNNNNNNNHKNCIKSEKTVESIISISISQIENKGCYTPIPTEKNGPLHTKLSNIIPLPFHFLPLKNTQQNDKYNYGYGNNNSSNSNSNNNVTTICGNEYYQSQVISPQVLSSGSSNSPNSTSMQIVTPNINMNELELTDIEQEELIREDNWALDAAYAFATTLSFPTPPSSPKNQQKKQQLNSNQNDSEDNDGY